MRRWLPLLAVSLGAFMLLLDVTIVNVALPSIAASLDAGFSSLQWVIDAYALALAALLLSAGAAADRVGRRRTYLVGLTVFALASLACGAANDSAQLIAARAAQGIGAAAMFTAGTALLHTSYTGRDRGIAFGVWGAVSGAAAAAGPLVGGLLTQGLGWRSVFLVNLPIAAATLVLVARSIPESRDPRARVDLPGALTFTIAAAATVVALIEAGEQGWTGRRTLGLAALAAVALAAFVLVERRSPHPLLDLALLRSPAFALLLVTAAVMQGAAFGHLAYVSIWLQTLLGLDPVRAGLALLPMSLSAFVAAAVAGRRAHDVRPELPVGVGMLLIGAGALLLRLVGPASGALALAPGLVVIGVGVGIGTPVIVSAALAAVEPRRAGMASGAVNTVRQLGMAVGIAGLGTLFSARVTTRIAAGTPAEAATTAGLDLIFLVSGAAAVLCGVTVLAVVHGRRGEPAPAPALTRR